MCLTSALSSIFWVSRSSVVHVVTDTMANLGAETHITPFLGMISSNDIVKIPVRKWAYTFLVGGVLNPLTDYRGFLYGVVVAATILRDAGSQADVVVMIQLSYNTNSTRLPQVEEDMLTSAGVIIKYLPKFAGEVHEQFYGLVMEKFRVLEMTEYSRVLFMDSDVMPLCNMDYMFEMSEPALVSEGETSELPLFKENVVISWKREAGHAGFFMLAPGPGKYNDLKKIIRRREEEVLNMSYPYWDPEIGWGHKFNNETDFWRSQSGTRGTLWNWWASFADQGLIYFWAKYHEKSVSIIIGPEIETWGTDKSGVLRVERTVKGGPLDKFSCVTRGLEFSSSPYRDYIHFTGKNKPWETEYAQLATKSSRSPAGLWFSNLRLAAQNCSFNISSSAFGAKSSVGRFSENRLMYHHIVAKKERGWTAYM